MTPIFKTLFGTAAAGAMAVSGASPAFANDYDRDDGIGIGEIIAGALIIGGIAAVASGGDDDYRDRRYDDRYDRYGDRYDRRDDRRYDRRYDRRRYNSAYSSRSAVERCVRAAEREAYRHGSRRAKVTDIRDVDRKGYGYRVKGRIAVDTGYRDSRYGRGWGNDYRGYRNDMRGWDSGKFTCRIERGRVVDLDFSGVRGLR